MKVCQINATYGFGSTGLIAKEINALADTNGIKIISCSQSSNDKSTYIIGNKFDWKLHALFTRIFGKQGYFSNIPTYKLIKYLKQESPDIVHLHNLHSNYINIKKLFNYLSNSNTNVIITLHDCWFFTGKCFHFADSNCNKWETCCNHCPQKHSSVNSWVFDRSKKVFLDKEKIFKFINKLTVVGCSNWITDLAKRSLIFKDKNVVCIGNGIDTSIFNSNNMSNIITGKYNLQDKFIILCFANKLMNNKNEDVKTNLINNLETDEILLVAGCNKVIKEQFSKYQNIICLDYIYDSSYMAQVYKSSNVFINLTLADTLPTVNMESICCGTPVITYNSCGSPELIDEGHTGYIIEQFDYIVLRDRLNKIKRKNISREECSSIGINSFDKNKQYLKYIELYKSLLSK